MMFLSDGFASRMIELRSARIVSDSSVVIPFLLMLLLFWRPNLLLVELLVPISLSSSSLSSPLIL